MSQQTKIDAINSIIESNNKKIQNMLSTDGSSADESDIALGKTAWVGGKKKVGTNAEHLGVVSHEDEVILYSGVTATLNGSTLTIGE